ncbi:MAG: hypothetical protein AAF230_00050 [Pseudomonadota bacterium]
MAIRILPVHETEIVINRQALLDVVCALDMGIRSERLPNALDALREPFFVDEFSSGTARTDFSVNQYYTAEVDE